MRKSGLFKRIQRNTYERCMPVYFPKNKAYDKGYCLSIWNDGLGNKNILHLVRNTHITLRKNGVPAYVIKRRNIVS